MDTMALDTGKKLGADKLVRVCQSGLCHGLLRFMGSNEKGVIHIFAILIFLVLSGALLVHFYGSGRKGSTATASENLNMADVRIDANVEQIRQLSYMVIDFSSKAAKMQVDIALNSWERATPEQKEAIKSLVFNTVQGFSQSGNIKNIDSLQSILQPNKD